MDASLTPEDQRMQPNVLQQLLKRARDEIENFQNKVASYQPTKEHFPVIHETCDLVESATIIAEINQGLFEVQELALAKLGHLLDEQPPAKKQRVEPPPKDDSDSDPDATDLEETDLDEPSGSQPTPSVQPSFKNVDLDRFYEKFSSKTKDQHQKMMADLQTRGYFEDMSDPQNLIAQNKTEGWKPSAHFQVEYLKPLRAAINTALHAVRGLDKQTKSPWIVDESDLKWLLGQMGLNIQRADWRHEAQLSLARLYESYDKVIKAGEAESAATRRGNNGELTPKEEELWLDIDVIQDSATECFHAFHKLGVYTWQLQMATILCLYVLANNIRSGWFDIKFQNFDPAVDNYLVDNGDGTFSAVFRKLKTERMYDTVKQDPLVQKIEGTLADILKKFLDMPGTIRDRPFESDFLFRRNTKLEAYLDTKPFTADLRDFCKEYFERTFPTPSLLRKIQITSVLQDVVKGSIDEIRAAGKKRDQGSLGMPMRYNKPKAR